MILTKNTIQEIVSQDNFPKLDHLKSFRGSKSGDSGYYIYFVENNRSTSEKELLVSVLFAQYDDIYVKRNLPDVINYDDSQGIGFADFIFEMTQDMSTSSYEDVMSKMESCQDLFGKKLLNDFSMLDADFNAAKCFCVDDGDYGCYVDAVFLSDKFCCSVGWAAD